MFRNITGWSSAFFVLMPCHEDFCRLSLRMNSHLVFSDLTNTQSKTKVLSICKAEIYTNVTHRKNFAITVKRQHHLILLNLVVLVSYQAISHHERYKWWNFFPYCRSAFRLPLHFCTFECALLVLLAGLLENFLISVSARHVSQLGTVWSRQLSQSKSSDIYHCCRNNSFKWFRNGICIDGFTMRVPRRMLCSAHIRWKHFEP